MTIPKQEDPQLKLRLAGDLKDRLQIEADKNGRSMTAEINHRLEASFGVKNAFAWDESMHQAFLKAGVLKP